jgi:hypothetical protein
MFIFSGPENVGQKFMYSIYHGCKPGFEKAKIMRCIVKRFHTTGNVITIEDFDVIIAAGMHASHRAIDKQYGR